VARILRLYALREITLPTLLALLTITFILMISYLYRLINLVFQPGVGLIQVLGLIGNLLPSILIFAAPMAVLTGVLIGVGRLMLDREVLAIRASGINLFGVFAPIIALTFLFSGSIFWLSSGPVPAMMKQAMLRVNQLRVEMANSLEPGRFHEDLLSGGPILYFREREPGTNRMLDITIEVEKKLTPRRLDAKIDEWTSDPRAGILFDNSTTGSRLVPIGARGESADPPIEWFAAGRATGGNLDLSEAGDPTARETELTLVFARTGQITIPRPDPGAGEAPDSEITLTLEDGSVHLLETERAGNEYVVISFDRAQRRMYEETRLDKQHHTIGTAQLVQRIAEEVALDLPGREGDTIGTLRKELWQRRSIWLASFVFSLVGIPLAIWVRPSGKSWGILIAIGLMLVYYVFLQMGLSMVQNSQPAGVAVTLMPNALYGLIGALLWWHTLRS
jgi:lipopolysaccharide export system permease protein